MTNRSLDQLIDGSAILITGGTGSFGRTLVSTLLHKYRPHRVIVFSRDELKQSEMQQVFPETKYPAIRYFIGDVRDRDRLYRAFDGVQLVVHAAALKQVPAAEYNPIEAVKTNVLGAANVIDAAIDRHVSRVIALSTDKAANPINLYGATKLCSDKLFVAGNVYVGATETRFSIVRYGNVVGSRGSVIPFFQKQRPTGTLSITDPKMTRFWITLQQGVDFVLDRLADMVGGEIFVPKIPSMNIMDLATTIAPECKHEFVGIRPGEKLHEIMVPEDDARNTVELEKYFAILPSNFGERFAGLLGAGKRCESSFSYRSDNNPDWLTAADLKEMVASMASSH